MRIASIALVAFFAIASFGPASAEDAAFTPKPKVLGCKKSVVTTYSSGSSINCSGTCFSDGVTRHWTCNGSHADVMCQLRCSPPPPKGGCLPF
jgi:hypothetical protein